MAPTCLVALWWIVLFAWMVVWFFVDLLIPGLDHRFAAAGRRSPEWLVFFFHPATLITAAIYGLYLRAEREFDPAKRQSGYMPGRGVRYPCNVFRKTFRM